MKVTEYESPCFQPKAEVADRVERGFRMEAPDGCPQNIYEIMRTCWEKDENKRPTFKQIHSKLHQSFQTLELNAAKQET